MRDLKNIILKYFFIVIGLILIRLIISTLFPDLITVTIVADNYTTTKDSLFGLYIENVFNIVLAVFVIFDLRKYGIRTLTIPILTIFSSCLGLFLAALLIINGKLKTEINEK